MSHRSHDVYPKMDLDGNYLGHEFPLCSETSFLTKGAKYSLIQADCSGPDVLVANRDSRLFAALCDSPRESVGSGPCKFAHTVELKETLPCHDKECDRENLGVI